MLSVLSLAGCADREEVYLPDELVEAELATRDGSRTLVLVGDVMPGDTMRDALRTHGVRYPFRATAALTRSADLAVANLETPVAERAKRRGTTGYFYRVSPGTLEGLRWAGFDVLGLANNHIRDCGDAGVRETLAHLSRAGFGTFGAGATRQEASRPFVAQVGGTRIAFVGFVSPETYLSEAEDLDRPGHLARRTEDIRRDLAATDARPGTLIADGALVRRLVQRARERADLVVVSAHWGIRYHRPIYAGQRRLAHAAIDAGADLVVGHHAHIWQPIEVYRGRPIVYGLGNFAFGSRNRRAIGGLVVRALLQGRSIDRLELYPTLTMNRSEQVLHQTKILEGRSAEAALRELGELSTAHGARLRIERGVGLLDLRPGPER